MIEAHPVLTINPAWEHPRGDRYVSHPHLRTAMIQLMDDPEFIYMVVDQRLPESIVEAVGMVEGWRNGRG